MSGRGPNWTKDEDAELIRMTREGFSSEAIAEKLGRSKQATESHRSLLRQRGVDLTRDENSGWKPGRPPQKAEKAPAANSKAATRKKRNCMCCGDEFTSDGPHNRLCKYCRQKSFNSFDRPVALAR